MWLSYDQQDRPPISTLTSSCMLSLRPIILWRFLSTSLNGIQQRKQFSKKLNGTTTGRNPLEKHRTSAVHELSSRENVLHTVAALWAGKLGNCLGLNGFQSSLLRYLPDATVELAVSLTYAAGHNTGIDYTGVSTCMVRFVFQLFHYFKKRKK